MTRTATAYADQYVPITWLKTKMHDINAQKFMMYTP